MMGRDWYGDIVECLVNTKNVSDSSPPQEIEYHITVSRILGAKSSLHIMLEKRLQSCVLCDGCFAVLGVDPGDRGV